MAISDHHLAVLEKQYNKIITRGLCARKNLLSLARDNKLLCALAPTGHHTYDTLTAVYDPSRLDTDVDSLVQTTRPFVQTGFLHFLSKDMQLSLIHI